MASEPTASRSAGVSTCGSGRVDDAGSDCWAKGRGRSARAGAPTEDFERRSEGSERLWRRPSSAAGAHEVGRPPALAPSARQRGQEASQMPTRRVGSRCGLDRRTQGCTATSSALARGSDRTSLVQEPQKAERGASQSRTASIARPRCGAVAAELRDRRGFAAPGKSSAQN